MFWVNLLMFMGCFGSFGCGWFWVILWVVLGNFVDGCGCLGVVLLTAVGGFKSFSCLFVGGFGVFWFIVVGIAWGHFGDLVKMAFYSQIKLTSF